METSLKFIRPLNLFWIAIIIIEYFVGFWFCFQIDIAWKLSEKSESESEWEQEKETWKKTEIE